MAKSEFVRAVDAIQASLRPRLRARGYKCRGRTFNRTTGDDLVQVVKMWLAPANPPGWTEIRGLRENYYGLFKVELGVYVPEVARWHMGTEAGAWVQETLCCVRTELSDDCGSKRGFWWRADPDDAVSDEVMIHLELSGLPFLERFSTRDKILSEWRHQTENSWAGAVPRIVSAIIYWARGETLNARRLLAAQSAEAKFPDHAQYVRQLAFRLGLGSLD